MTAFACRVDGRPAQALVLDEQLVVDDQTLPYVDLDTVELTGTTVRCVPVDGAEVTITHLARGRDDFVHRLITARAAARRAAMLQWTGDRPLDTFSVTTAPVPTSVVLFADGLTVEPLNGPPTLVPLGLLHTVDRDGYRFVLRARGLPPVTVGPFGPRTDEFAHDLSRARREVAERAAQAFTELDDRLAGFSTPLGLAVGPAEAGSFWPVLLEAAGRDRAAEVELLASLAGDRLRVGLAALARDRTMPFVLAPAGSAVAVEGTGDEARATYVFRTDDVDRLNLALALTSFRREALYLPVDRLGRWRLAARLSEPVRWARSVLTGRVVHDETWADRVTALLT